MFRLLGSLLMGALVGWIAGHLMGTKGGLLRNIVVGVIGSFVGSFVCAFLGFYAYGFLATLVVNVVGACLFIWLGRRHPRPDQVPAQTLTEKHRKKTALPAVFFILVHLVVLLHSLPPCLLSR